MTEQEQQDTWEVLGIRTDIPDPARVYDYMLGGKDNFAADRETAERSLELVPEMLDSSRGNRQFLVRAVRFLRDAGIRQFLDIGTGLPTSPNTHETAQEGHPDTARTPSCACSTAGSSATPAWVLVSRWRPDADVPAHHADRAWSYCGIALI